MLLELWMSPLGWRGCLCVCFSCVLANFQPLMQLSPLSHMFHFCSIHGGRLFNFPRWYQQLPPLCCLCLGYLSIMKALCLAPAQITNCLLSFAALLSEGIITSCIFVCLCLCAAVLMGWEVPCCSCSCFSLPQGISACGEEKQFLRIASPSWDASDTDCSVIWNIVPLTSFEGRMSSSIYAYCEGCGVCT